MQHKPDVFDALFISTREDSYTSLVGYLFNNYQQYKQNFCTFFNVNSENTELLLRKAFEVTPVIATGGRKKITPDMLLISHNDNKIVLIENKILSGEGFKQTEAYECPEAEQRYRDILNGAQIEYYFMTLNGCSASSQRFIPISWIKFIEETTKGCQFVSPYDRIQDDLLNRAREYSEFNNKQIGELSFDELLKEYNGGWIDEKAIVNRYFHDAITDICKDQGLRCHVGIPDGASKQIMIQFFDDSWQGPELWDENHIITPNAQETRNLHIEFNWNVGSKNASLHLHYETNPYLSEEDMIANLPASVKESFDKEKENFRKKIGTQISGSRYWKPDNHKLAMVTCKFKNFSFRANREITNDFYEAAKEIAYAVRQIV